MDKEQLIKLAVVAGVAKHDCQLRTYSDGRVVLSIPDSSNPFTGKSSRIWRPHEDIAQAFEVLEGLGQNYDICKSDYLTDSYRVEIFYDNFNEDIEEDGPTVPEAICNAVLKATEQG